MTGNFTKGIAIGTALGIAIAGVRGGRDSPCRRDEAQR